MLDKDGMNTERRIVAGTSLSLDLRPANVSPGTGVPCDDVPEILAVVVSHQDVADILETLGIVRG